MVTLAGIVVDQGDTQNVNFTDFTFFSPILKLYECCEIQPLINEITEVTYYYLILIMVVVIVLKADVHTITEFLNSIRLKLMIVNEHVSMNS